MASHTSHLFYALQGKADHIHALLDNIRVGFRDTFRTPCDHITVHIQ